MCEAVYFSFCDTFLVFQWEKSGIEHWFCSLFQQQITSFQTEKNRLSLTLEERTEQERAEQSKTLERLEQEIESRGKAEAAAAEAERQRSVLAVDLKDMHQKFERLQQEYNAVLDTVNTRMRQSCTARLTRTTELQIKLIIG